MRSMTAFARVEQLFDWGTISWQLRSVNQRYLETHLKLPDALKHLEMDCREEIKHALSRGKVEGVLNVETKASEQGFELDQSLLSNLGQAVSQIQMTLPEATHVNPLELLNWPGLVKSDSAIQVEPDQLAQNILESLNQALNKLDEARQREGDALANIIADKIAQMHEHVNQVKTRFPDIMQKQTDHLKQRIIDLAEQVDEQRFLQEVAMITQKADISEELDRLVTHLNEVSRLIQTNDVVGRRLDFLMQELNREANTLGSKSIHAFLSQTSVELKVLIEQIREQVQNIE